MRIHYIQHEPFEAPGYILNWIEEHKFTVTSTHIYEKIWFPDQNSFDFLIIMGGSMSVNDDDLLPWLAEEKLFVKESILNKKKVIGICLGSQLIANVLGNKVYPNKYKEIGWFPVKKSSLGKYSPLINHFPDEFVTMHWHGETFDLLPNCAQIFESEGCKNQGFIYKNNVIGLQFHPEMTLDTIRGMIDASDTFESGRFIQNFEDIKNGAKNCIPNNGWLCNLLDKLAKTS
ncbi:MAG: type 1 glutamine amidotransferase [Bacteroidota bacterium]|nr:type 1 glutamine amidotransferase [Bacteroidota bacterium]